ncbi:M20/M25/M40 family metallo-hydrolase [Tianweitania sp. BSSL-BM11]|uniref:M20/M25/M40 family metallo-hydrolase n=1 Tax=Tianweitania aestuarii TaxID=2814886 RepID=A0ABS5RRA9_9HYPH|nr:M20/M25/M40 family metallo-hydrolase [Tianweitania aestuarii]MBS9719593.1 M20/M25/M40 family metallo-hydrolase [Tianweitania aestuarii]
MGTNTALAGASALIDSELDLAVADLQRMIATDTRFPPGNGYDAFAGLMEEILAPLAMDTQRVTVPEDLWFVPRGPASGPRINLLAETQDERPACSLYFHVDTVCAATGWQRDPLRLTEENGVLYGLGAADMKGAVAAAVHALRCAKKAGLPLAYRPQLLLCTDEEGGLYPGIRYLAEQGLIKGHLLNFNGSAGPRIWGGCFGSFNLQVTVEGFAAHAADHSKQAVNAIEAALPMMQAVQDLRADVSQTVSQLPPPPGSPPLAAQIAITVANGGTCGGQVPDRFTFLVSRRYAPEEDFDTARKQIEDVIRAACPHGATLHFDLIGHLIPTADPEGPHLPRWLKAVQEGFGYRPEEFAKYAAASASDTGYAQQAGAVQEAILGGLIRPTSNAHGAEEHTTRADLAALSRTILCYLASDFTPDLNPDL